MTPPALHAGGTVLSKVQIHAVLHGLAVSWGFPPPLWCPGRCATMAHVGRELVGGERVKVSASLWNWRTWGKLHLPAAVRVLCPPRRQVRVRWLRSHNPSLPFSGFATKPAGEGKFSAPAQPRWRSRGVSFLKACGGLNPSHLWRAKNANPHL